MLKQKTKIFLSHSVWLFAVEVTEMYVFFIVKNTDGALSVCHLQFNWGWKQFQSQVNG